MTTNYHTAIASNAPLNSAVIETPLAALDSAITNIAAGSTSLTGLNLGTSSTLTIAGGIVTRTRPRHSLDTEGAATTDDLTTINGGSDGDILLIDAVSASRVVTIKHGTGNISLYGKIDYVLDDIRKTIELVYDGSQWVQTNGLPTTALTYPAAAPFRRPTSMPIMLTPAARNFWAYRAAAATIQPVGIAAPTITGAAAANTTDSTYVSHTTGAVIGNSAGTVTATYNLVRTGHNPKFSAVINFTDITAVRGWFGLCSAAVTTVDTIAAGTSAVMFRFSTVAGDVGFVPVVNSGAAQTTGSAMNTIAAATRYVIEAEVIGGVAYFTVNNGTPVALSTNLPATTTELGANLIVFTTAAAAKVWGFSRFFVEFD